MPNQDHNTAFSTRHQLSRLLALAMEALLLGMICLAPWVYGAVHTGFEFLLDAGIGLLLLLWGARMLLEGELTWKKSPVAFCLASLCLIGIWQLAPLGKPLLERLSPSTARLYGQLLPSQPEQLPFGEQRDRPDPLTGATISFYPHATRVQTIRLVAIFLLFVLVSNNLASPGALGRLSVATLLNGTLLALFALVQLFSSRGMLYWTYKAQGAFFGPFICKNHFPFYINMCIGLGLGLLWSRQSDRRHSSRGRSGPFLDDERERWPSPEKSRHASRREQEGPGRFWPQTPWSILQEPRSLAICLALALMITSVAFSLSRGGFLALLGGFFVCLLLKLSSSAPSLRLGAGLVCLMAAVGLAGWLGMDKVQARLATLWQGNPWQEERLPLWANSLAVARDFPLWGTGYGTYRYLGPLYYRDASLTDETVEHVHNDYLEMLAEGGVGGLLLSLLTTALVLWFGYRAVRDHPSRKVKGLALGALFALITVFIHSIGDFGLRIPAIMLLTTVIAAQLCALGSGERPAVTDPALPANVLIADRYQVRWWGLAPLLGALTCAALALLLVQAGWRRHQTEVCRLLAFRLGQSATLDSQTQRIAFLEAAAHMSPDDAELRTELGEVCAELYSTQREALARQHKVCALAEASLIGPAARLPVGAWNAAPAPLAGWLATSVLRERPGPEVQALQQKYLVDAVRAFQQGRERCPVSPGPHLGLAAQAALLSQGVSAEVDLQRVQLLAPCDPLLWYYCGLQEFRSGQLEQAWKSWRRSLELSERLMAPILEQSSKHLDSAAVLDKVLPDRAPLLWQAANRLFPPPDLTAEGAVPFLQKALRLLNADLPGLSNEDLLTKARIQKALQQRPEALLSYQALLARDPLRPAWRFEMAQLLYENGELRQSRKELSIVMALEPNHPQAQILLDQIERAER